MYELEILENENKCIIKISENLKMDQLKKIANFFKKCNFEIVKSEKLSIEQMKLTHVLLKELGELIGYEKEEMRVLLQNEFCSKRGIEYFSLSPFKKKAASKDIATDFITFIIEWAIANNYNLILHEGYGTKRTLKSAREVCPDIRRYVIACLRARTCAICGSNFADLHHYDSVASIGGYEHDDGLKTRFMSLCREHHSLFHSIEKIEFEKTYHLDGVWLNPNLVIELKKVYSGHFQAFKIENFKGDKL